VELETRVRLAIMHAFLAGGTPTVASIARELSATEDDVGEAFDRLAAGRAIVLDPGTRTIRMAAPFAGGPTAFSVVTDGRSLYANCIWDSLGVAAMRAGPGQPSRAEITTRCPDCHDALRVTVSDDGVTADPPGAVVHFAVPAARWWADIVFT
jgi:hypothetical protein